MKNDKYSKFEKLDNTFKANGDRLIQYVDDCQEKFSSIKSEVIKNKEDFSNFSTNQHRQPGIRKGL